MIVRALRSAVSLVGCVHYCMQTCERLLVQAKAERDQDPVDLDVD